MSRNVIGLKSEFEAEGLTQLEIADYFTRNPGYQYRVVKIGGCEAKTDFRAAVRLGANVVVAPMIESWFAAKKFGNMYRSSGFGRRWINIETVEGVRNLKEILDTCQGEGISGVVIGRGDLAESMGLERSQVETPEVHSAVLSVADATRSRGLHVGVGGMISSRSKSNLEDLIDKGLIDHFETRKTLLSCDSSGIDEGIREGLKIESEWISASLENLDSMSRDLTSRLKRLQSSEASRK